jgi:predicted small integral membrane protein
LSAAYINLAWIGMTDINQWYGAGIGFAVLFLIMLKG